MINIFRTDKTNVGDAYCPPFMYFPFKEKKYIDILALNSNFEGNVFSNNELVIFGGGGLGKNFFLKNVDVLEHLKNKFNLKIIGWGIGYDLYEDRQVLLDDKYPKISNFFDFFEIIGTRVYPTKKFPDDKYIYVPCASCMSDLFYYFRKKNKIKKNKIGIYSHKRTLLNHHFPEYSHMTNEVFDFSKVLDFLSSHEFIVTNSYHGVYWATLLGTKVICLPSKSGLYSFKYKPTYLLNYDVNDKILESAVSYNDSLDECRDVNFNFYKKIYNNYGGI